LAILFSFFFRDFGRLGEEEEEEKEEEKKGERACLLCFFFLSLTVGVCCVSVCWMYAACVVRVREWNIV
jgi:hypothetical protein